MTRQLSHEPGSSDADPGATNTRHVGAYDKEPRRTLGPESSHDNDRGAMLEVATLPATPKPTVGGQESKNRGQAIIDEITPVAAVSTTEQQHTQNIHRIARKPLNSVSIRTLDAKGSQHVTLVKDFAEREDLGGWFPRIMDDESKSWRIWLSRRSRALMLQIAIIGLILITNLGLTIYAVSSYGSNNGVGLVYEGECSTVRALDLWLHLLINLLSTGLLSASNYCMQLQAAPMRKDVDKAHEAGKWLDIGIPSFRNLMYISWRRRVTWALLAFSSVPIHIIYNSAVFQSLSSHSYTVAVVKDSFLDGETWNLTAAEERRFGDPGWYDEEGFDRTNPQHWNYTEKISIIQRNASSYDIMNVSACFELYNDYWIPQGNVILLVANKTVQEPINDSLLMYVGVIPRSDNWAKNMLALGNGTSEFRARPPALPVTQWLVGLPKLVAYSGLLMSPASPQRLLMATCRFCAVALLNHLEAKMVALLAPPAAVMVIWWNGVMSR